MKNTIVNYSILSIYYYKEIGMEYQDTPAGRQGAAAAYHYARRKGIVNADALRRASDRYMEEVKKELIGG